MFWSNAMMAGLLELIQEMAFSEPSLAITLDVSTR